MQLNSDLKVTGSLTIKKFNSKEELIEQVHVPNLIVKVGKNYIAERMTANTTSIINRMAIGGNNTLPTQSDTGLISIISDSQMGTPTIDSDDLTITFDALFDEFSQTGTLVEAGIFNSTETVTSFTVGSASNTTLDVDSKIVIAKTAHGLNTGTLVKYTVPSGGTAITGLTSGGLYYVIRVDADKFRIASSYADALTPTPIGTSIGAGAAQSFTSYTLGTMLCRSTFAPIVKGVGDSIAISWVVRIG